VDPTARSARSQRGGGTAERKRRATRRFTADFGFGGGRVCTDEKNAPRGRSLPRSSRARATRARAAAQSMSSGARACLGHGSLASAP